LSGRRFASPFPLRAALPLIATVLLLGGCAVGPDWAAIAQQAAQLRAGCESQYTAGTIKTALATEQCADPPIHNLYASAGYPDLDVLDAYFAKREAIAAQLDRHAIAPEEARAEFAQALVDQNTALQQRATNRAVGFAAINSTMPVYCNRVGHGSMICQ
jgi:hypothetical protein